MNDPTPDQSPIRAVLAASPEQTTDSKPPQPQLGTAPEDELQSRLQSRLVVLATIFIAAGPFGIPLLWVNKRFSPGERIFWSIVAILYSIGVLLLGGVALMWIWERSIGSL